MAAERLVPRAADRVAVFPDHAPTVPAFLRSITGRFGDRVAAVLGDQRLTYAELERRSADLARGMLASGVAKGTHVGLLFPNGPDFLVHWFAITRIGAVAVLCNTFSKPRELGLSLRRADVAHLHTVDAFLGNDYAERLEQCVDGLAGQTGPDLFSPSHPFLRRIRVWGDRTPAWAGAGDAALAAARTAAPAVDDAFLRAAEASVTPADPAVMIFSSGTTADPKVVVHGQGTVVRHPRNMQQFYEVLPDDVVYAAMPLFWVGGLSHTALNALHAGARLVFEDRFDAAATLDLLEREQVTVLFCWPDLAKAITQLPGFADRSVPLRPTVLELIPPDRRPARPDLLANSLGMSETLGPHLVEGQLTVLPEDKLGSFGRGVPGTEHKVVDPETGEALGPRQHGEICVRGYSTMLGLYGRERHEVFDADGWYHTGDGGWYDEDGHVYFTGRLGDTIKTKGANVSPREVEAVAHLLPEVLHVAVVGLPHPEHGQDVAAVVVPRPGRSTTAEAVVAALRAELSAYKVPRYVAVLSEHELPWMDSQKIDRRAVAALLAERFPDR